MISKRIIPFLLIAAAVLWASCGDNSGGPGKSRTASGKRAFDPVNGIRFIEVKRRFRSGLSFNQDGYQQRPSWIIEFKAPDTMLAYDPGSKEMQAFYLTFDHGKVYNFAREFFRAITISPDSLVLQRLEVNGKVIAGDDDVRSDVYCTFYSKAYLDRHKLSPEELQKPSKADTAYIRQLAATANADPGNPQKAFAATEPVIFTPKSRFVTAEKISTVDETNNRPASYDYMYPQYKLMIQRSYKEMNHSFSVVVSPQGKLFVNRVDGVMPDDVPPRKRLLQGISRVYLENLFHITPGKTMGIPHSSEVTIYLKGKTAN